MKYKEAKESCHVRSAIYRACSPCKKYAKNHQLSFDERVPTEDQKATDWMEYDPNDFYDTSLGADSY